MKKVFVMLGAAIGLMFAMFMQGCASLGDNVATEKLVIQYATMKVIEADKDAMAERAAKVYEIARHAQLFLNTDTADIALLRTEVHKRLPPDLSPADHILANALIDTVMAELQARVGSGLVPPDKKLQVNAVLGWIREAAYFYVA